MSEKNRIPEIRFKGFEGEWEEKRLGDFGDVLSCKRIYKNETTEAGEIPFYKIGSFGNIADSFISREIFLEYKEKYSYPKIGQVLISASGTLGRTVIYNGEEAYFQDSNIVWLDNDTDKLTNEFLYNFYQKTKWNTTEGSTIKRLYNKDIISKRIILPKVKEQNKISNILNNLNEVINKCDYLLQKNIELKQSMLQKMFPMEGEKVPEIRFEGFEGEWEVDKLNNIATFEKGRGYNKDDISLDKNNLTEIILYGHLFTEYKWIINSYNYYAEKKHNSIVSVKGDVIMPSSSTTSDDSIVTASAVGKDGIIIGGDINIIRVRNFEIAKIVALEITNTFLKKQIYKKVEGITIRHLYNENLKNIKVLYPKNENETKLINSLFQSIDNQITLQQQKLDRYKKLKKTLLYKMFI